MVVRTDEGGRLVYRRDCVQRMRRVDERVLVNHEINRSNQPATGVLRRALCVL